MSFIGKQPTLNRTKYTPLSADPTNPTEGDVFYSDGTSRSEGLWVYKDLTFIPVSASSGGLDVYSTEDFEANSASSFTTGNNATFLGAGAVVGVVEDETVSPISKRKSLKYTQAAGSLNDYYASPIIVLDSKQKDNQSYVTFYYTYDGNNEDIAFNIYDVTNNKDLTNGLVLVSATTKATRKSATFFIPSTATSLRFGMQVKVENIGAILVVDDIEFSTKPITVQNIANLTEWQDYTPTSQGLGTPTFAVAKWRQVGANMELSFKLTPSASSAVEMQIGLPNNEVISLSEVPTVMSKGHLVRIENITTQKYTVLATGGDSFLNFGNQNSSQGLTPLNANAITGANLLSIEASIPIEGWVANNPSVVTTFTQAYSEYNAVIDAAATIDSTNVPNWLLDINVTISGSNYVIDFSSLGLTIPPLIQVTPDTAVAGISAGWRSVTSTSARVDIYNSSGSSITTEGFSFSLKPQHPDFKPADFLGALPTTSSQLDITDGITEPSTVVGIGRIYIDVVDGDLKIKFGDGTIKTIVTDT